jgi:hypothetical protein
VFNVHDRGHIDAIGTTGVQLTSLKDRYHYMQGDADWPLIELIFNKNYFQSERAASNLLKHKEFATEILREIEKGNVQFFFDDPTRWQAHINRNCRLVCGTRLHGGIAALNAGVPAIVTNTDARARESCELFGIPYRPNWSARTDLLLEEMIEAADVTDVNAKYSTLYNNFEAWARSFGFNITFGSSISPAMRSPSQIIDKEDISRRVKEVVFELRMAYNESRIESLDIQLEEMISKSRSDSLIETFLSPSFTMEVSKAMLSIGIKKAGVALYNRSVERKKAARGN